MTLGKYITTIYVFFKRKDTHANHLGTCVQIFRVQQRYGTVFPQRLPGPKLSDVRVAAASGAQDAGSDGDGFKMFFRGSPHSRLPLKIAVNQ